MKEHSPLASTPVFNCLVHVRQTGSDAYEAVAIELDGVVGQGSTRRDALASVVAKFKTVMADYVARGEAVPWKRPAPAPAPHEQQVFIAVHL